MGKERKISKEGALAGESCMSESFTMERELIVIVRPEAGIRATKEGIASTAGIDITPLADFLTSEGVALQPLFGVNEEKLKYEALSFTEATGVELPDLSLYYRVEAPDERLDELAERLREFETVEAAYVKPAAELPQMINDMTPSAEEAPPVTPDFTPRQEYLNAAPAGIDAHYAWTLPGGKGEGVRIIDIEGAWRFTHEDLLQRSSGLVGGIMSSDIGWRNHGTAVIGEFSGDQNSIGITGICPDGNVRAISIFGPGQSSARAIRQAADMLRSGDIILIELHRAGPRFNFQPRLDQKGYIPLEWWPDDFDAICYATSRGIIVVEAGGNGGENLDDPIYNTPAPGFPASWTNPFNRANRDSGAIVVGAGAPPPGTHGRDWGPDRSRLDFSNYGSIIDAQGWGREVTTCGYGDLQGGSNEDFWYTDQFGGTSSASPIVVGAIGCVQGILRAQGRPLLTPIRARECLRTTGSPQQDAPGRPHTQRIGNRPNLRQLIQCATGKLKEHKEFKEFKEKEKDFKDIKEKEIKDKKDFKEKEFIKDKKDFKEKEFIKDKKDFKEKEKEIAKIKEIKERIKEHKEKEKERKEFKEFKDKDIKDSKEFKEHKDIKDRKEFKDKDIKDRKEKDKEIKEKDMLEGFAIQPEKPVSFEERITRIENAIGELAHFIGVELRPDLGETSLTQEPDLANLSEQLQKQAIDAKEAKDYKDSEKPSEYIGSI